MYDLPKVIFMNSKVYDTIMMRFQIKSKLVDELSNGSTKFVSYILEFVLRDFFHKSEVALVHNVTVTPTFYSEFCIIDVELHYSVEGLSKTDQIIATVMRARDSILPNVNLKLYADLAHEIRNIFNTKPVEMGTKVARKMAEGILKFGYTHAFSGTDLLKLYDKQYVNMILDNLIYQNLLVVIQGDFTTKDIKEHPQQEYTLRNIFSLNFFRRFNFGIDDGISESKVIISREIAPFKLHVFIQNISKEDVAFLKGKEREIEIPFVHKNPYKITDEFAQESKYRSGRYLNHKDHLGKIARIEGYENLFYRKNSLFAVP